MSRGQVVGWDKLAHQESNPPRLILRAPAHQNVGVASKSVGRRRGGLSHPTGLCGGIYMPNYRRLYVPGGTFLYLRDIPAAPISVPRHGGAA